jgi:hypothetical protein
MADASKDDGIIQVLAERLETQRLPRALSLKAKVDGGETLSEFVPCWTVTRNGNPWQHKWFNSIKTSRPGPWRTRTQRARVHDLPRVAARASLNPVKPIPVAPPMAIP